MECKRWMLVMLLVVGLLAGVAAAESRASQDVDATAKRTKDQVTAVWEAAEPWIQWVKEKAQVVANIVYQKASFQGVKDTATEAGSIGLDAGTGHPYQAAYKVAKDVPVVGEQVKNVIGEAHLREKAEQEEL